MLFRCTWIASLVASICALCARPAFDANLFSSHEKPLTVWASLDTKHRRRSVSNLRFRGLRKVVSSPSVHEAQGDIVSHPWIKRSRVDKHATLPVRFGLTQRNLDHGHDLLLRISDPASKEYGRHLSAEEVVDLFSPAQESVEAVRVWIASTGIPHTRISVSDNKQWLQFDAHASELETLLGAKYYHYDHVEDGSQAIACERYHLPKEIQQHVDFVKPGILGTFISSAKEPQKNPARDLSARDTHNQVNKRAVLLDMDDESGSGETQDCSKRVTPGCVRELYNITDPIKKVQGNTVWLYQTQMSYYNDTDLDLFFKTYAKEIKQGTRPQTKYIAGAPKQKAGVDKHGPGEGDLDLQIVYPFVYPNEVTMVQVYDRYYQNYRHVPFGLFNVFLDAIDGSYCNRTAFGITGNTPKFDGKIPNPHKGGYSGPLQCGIFKPPKVVSFSYISGEELLSVPYMRRMCQEFMKLGLQGTSFFFGSGDSGAAPRKCKTSTNGTFFVGFPSGCPYVTSVGGTRIPPGSPPVAGVEHAASVPSFGPPPALFFYSGGGFSNVFPRPAYQDKAVQNYLDMHNPPYPYYQTTYHKSPPKNSTGRYNRIGRGYPDVAAIAQYTANIGSGHKFKASGTSLSTPLFAGLISRINGYRLLANKTTLGFLNPSMYRNPSMFNDVIHGDNPGCRREEKGYNHGFLCAPGWDPVTGLGTPNYAKMLEYYMGLP